MDAPSHPGPRRSAANRCRVAAPSSRRRARLPRGPRASAALLLLAAVPALAGAAVPAPPVTAPPLASAPAAAAWREPPPLRLADDPAVAAAALPAAAVGAGDSLAAMAAWNAGSELPRQIGFARPLPLPIAWAAGAAAGAARPATAATALASSRGGELVWGARVEVAAAHRLRLRLDAALLPAGTRLWVWGTDGTPRAFGLELRTADGTLWTPSVAGESIAVEVALPVAGAATAAAALAVAEVLELFPAAPAGQPAAPPACLVDAACVGPDEFPAVDLARRAVAHLEFVRPGALVTRAFLCTGSLLNDRDEATAVPLLLTARHCFASAEAAASLEAFFDYHPPACGAPPPPLKDLPRSTGATLLATVEQADATLVRLHELPPGRAFLGWTTAPRSDGSPVHRLSHPFHGGEVLPQSWALARVDDRFEVCTGYRRPHYLYSRLQRGGTLGGSSGSPAMTPEGLVVGQLLGTCSGTPGNPCDPRGAEVDGALVGSFEVLAPFLDPRPVTPCEPSPFVLCLDGKPGDGRYRVEATWSTAQAGRVSGDAVAVPLPAGDATRGGVFWFFTPQLPEVLVKLVDGCAANGHRWVFLGPATNVGTTVIVTDTVSGQRRVYASADLRPAPPVHDTTAFRCDG